MSDRPTAQLATAPWRHSAAALSLVLVVAVAFGGIDQYIGSLNSPFLTGVSGMSAPWLLLPFAIGALQPRWRRAAWLGLAATWLAVAAYVVMIDSPVEGAHLTLRALALTALSQWPWFLGGLVSGPLYAVLGYRWRVSRSWLIAAVAVIPVLCEPVIGPLGLRPWSFPPASYAEAVLGVILAGYFALAAARSKSSGLRP